MSDSNHFFGVDRSTAAFRPASRHDINYILEKTCPYLQIVGIMELPDMEETVEAPAKTVEKKEPTQEEMSAELRHIVFGNQLDDGLFGEPALIHLRSGWTVHYWRKTDEFPPAMCISAGEEIIE